MNGKIPDDISALSLALHEKHRGKLSVEVKVPLKSRNDLTLAYTPGVAAVCREIARDRSLAYRYTIKGNTVAIVTDGSAVLGLGNIGGYAAIPVMEGKAALFKKFAGIDAFPICFEHYETDFTDAVRNIAPVFGGINLEDIAAPKCFQVEEDLQDLGIPVMHDDQHGTAIVVLAALMNACKVTKKSFEDLNIVVCGAGAAGYAITRMLRCIGYQSHACSAISHVTVCDTQGIISRNREGLYENKYKYILAGETNHRGHSGTLTDALYGADVLIGVSTGGIVTREMVEQMNPDPVIFAMANPVPEIMPEVALAAGAAVVGTGRSDFPNQINNVLAFPGVFRGALDACATTINEDMKFAAAYALAEGISRPNRKHILPNPLDRRVAPRVAAAVQHAARESGDCINR
jgi:malate dehydrogenase (oxaloacetate-decarboxylating)